MVEVNGNDAQLFLQNHRDIRFVVAAASTASAAKLVTNIVVSPYGQDAPVKNGHDGNDATNPGLRHHG